MHIKHNRAGCNQSSTFFIILGYLLRQRIKMLFRYYKESIFSSSILIFFISIILIVFLYASGKHTIPIEVKSILFLLVLNVVHLNRKDKNYLKLFLYRHHYILFLIEYLFLSIPVFILLGQSEKLYLIIPYILLLFIIAKTEGHTLFYRYIPKVSITFFKNCFEWASGLRKYNLYLLVYFFSLLILTVNSNVSFFSVLFLALTVALFYGIQEKTNYIMVYPINSFQFLLLKQKHLFIQYFAISLFPFIISYYLTQSNLLIIIYLSTYLFLLPFSLIKYATYPNSFLMSIIQSLYTLLYVASIIFPASLPIIILATIFIYSKSYNEVKILMR